MRHVPGGGLQFSNSVWYAFTADQDGTVALSTTGSSYPIGGAVLTGTPAAFSTVSCFLDSTSFSVQAGQTYVIDLLDRSEVGGGGDLALSLQYVVPPTATVALTGGSFDPRSGEATITGTATCANGELYIGDINVSQEVGRIATIQGYGYASWVPCDGSARDWSATIDPYSGKFAGGKAQVSLYWSIWNPVGYDSGSIDETIVLKRR